MLSLLLIRGFYVNDTYMQALMKFSFQNNHLVGRILITYETKISPGPEIEPGSPGVRASSITTKPPRRSTCSIRKSSVIGFPLTLQKH